MTPFIKCYKECWNFDTNVFWKNLAILSLNASIETSKNVIRLEGLCLAEAADVGEYLEELVRAIALDGNELISITILARVQWHI